MYYTDYHQLLINYTIIQQTHLQRLEITKKNQQLNLLVQQSLSYVNTVF